MRVLLDTNILIHRETATIVRDNIGDVFRWLDLIGAEKCIHPQSINEIQNHKDQNVVQSFKTKLRSYHELKTLANDTPELIDIRNADRTINDSIDTDLIREVLASRVDLLLSEDQGIHRKAEILGITDRVLRIEDFLAQVIRENPDLIDYNILSIRKEYFGNINLDDPFFNSFKRDYKNFTQWFNYKSDEVAYVCHGSNNAILAFLYLKREGNRESYSDIFPVFTPKKRLKIGSFKVAAYGLKLGERFLKIVFDNALRLSVDEIYVTIFENNVEHKQLIAMLESWGFVHNGTKTSINGVEGVWVRYFTPHCSLDKPALTYPYMSFKARKFIVPIYPKYHTELFPDSILRTESPMDFIENLPHRNAIRKAYISRSYFRELESGDIIVFYRTKDRGPAHYTAVTTTLGIVESVRSEINDFNVFRRVCAGISVFPDNELREHWNYNPNNRPFVVRFLCTYSLPKRQNLSQLKEAGVLAEHPRGFELLTDAGFNKLLEISNAKDCPVVNQA